MSRSAINGEGAGFYSSVSPSPTVTSSRNFIMKRIHQAILVASVLSLPLLSIAATVDTPITRAQVRAELVAAEQAGQYPRSYVNYPDATPDLAQTHAANREAAQATGNASYGPSSTGTFATGFRHLRTRIVASERAEVNDIYRGK
jgi:hypothetical protein